MTLIHASWSEVKYLYLKAYFELVTHNVNYQYTAWHVIMLVLLPPLQEYPVSSLLTMSQEPTRASMYTREKSPAAAAVHTTTHATQFSAKSSSSGHTDQPIRELQDQYDKLSVAHYQLTRTCLL